MDYLHIFGINIFFFHRYIFELDHIRSFNITYERYNGAMTFGY